MTGFDKNIMNADEVSLWLRIPKSTLYKLCINGEIPCTKVGKHWRFDRTVLAAWFEQRVREGIKEGIERSKENLTEK